jgi:hypothetical protein
MPALTQLLTQTNLMQVHSADDPHAPENTEVVELRTADGATLRTADTIYVRVPG